MKWTYSIAFAILVVLFSFTGGRADPLRRYALGGARHEVARSYQLQTVSVQASCFPPKLRGILAHIAAETHREPIVTSGLRAHASRRGSLHRRCMAADIRVPGASYRAIVAAAASAPDIGGIGTYCNGIVHVDIGPKRTWNYCTRQRRYFRPSVLIASAEPRSAERLRFKLRRTIAKSTPPIRKATTKYTTIAMSISKAKVPVLVSSVEPEARSGSQR
jgi:hypothetical protein